MNDLRVHDVQGEPFVAISDLRLLVQRASVIIALHGLQDSVPAAQALGASTFAQALDETLANL